MLHHEITRTHVVRLTIAERLRVLLGAHIAVRFHTTTTVCQDAAGHVMYPRALTNSTTQEVFTPTRNDRHFTGLLADQKELKS